MSQGVGRIRATHTPFLHAAAFPEEDGVSSVTADYAARVTLFALRHFAQTLTRSGVPPTTVRTD